VEREFDDRDVTSILSGRFDIDATLAETRDDVRIIRWLLEDGDEEAEADEDDPAPPT
jgi:hypothetical protein